MRKGVIETKKVFNDLRDDLREKFEFYQQGIRGEDALYLSEDVIPMVIQDNPSFKIYRYMPPDYFNIRNIEKQTIHLSANGDMNDVYEGIVREYNESNYKKFQQLSDMSYMTCFSETNDNILMWSHYAKGHTGFCVEYDLKLLKNDKYKITEHLLPIVYDDNLCIDRDIDWMLENHKELKEAIRDNNEYDGDKQAVDVLPLFLIKSKKWKYEKEWRIIYTLKQMYDVDDDVLYGKNIPFKCVAAVYLGVKIHPEIKQNIIEICKRLSNTEHTVNVYQAKIGSDRSKVGFEQVKNSII